MGDPAIAAGLIALTFALGALVTWSARPRHQAETSSPPRATVRLRGGVTLGEDRYQAGARVTVLRSLADSLQRRGAAEDGAS